ncbi:class I SAM-dependent methyltransferase [Streptomyces malaysiensis]|uniref:Class I SAM-dependent methyltransferase n=1 Tax=Streptomyces malaysiensis subsp. samsunensis TaxID=459658 RepID=A0A9X2M6W5_STRMQ|nr:class I SAM-dependent methyltransferase [Streptomyces samsunensis]MCQ8836181.1 class I SAM-dependent methyltransferase [Streptomyces samsunensis]
MTHPTTTAVAPPVRDPARLAAQYDAFHTARARTPLVARLYAAALGEDYPEEVAASSSCDWPLLGLITMRLRMRPGRLLVDAGCGTGGIGLWLARALDAGCGTGGIGLWLARALAARLIGFDLSPVAVAQATARRDRFLVPAGRAAFRVAELDATGLPDGCAHGVVCVDALSLAADRGGAVCELGRLLAPGARLVLTRALRRSAEPVWEDQARAAGLTLEHVDERPHEPAMWERLYRLWIDHADQIRRELGDVQAERMLAEAHRMLPALPGRRAVLLTLRRPPTVPAPLVVADRMTGPGRPDDDGPATSERTPS